MSWSKPSSELNEDKPQKKLFSLVIIGSILLQTLIQFVVQVYAIQLLKKDPKYIPIDDLMIKRHLKHKDSDLSENDWENIRSVSYETTVIFLVSIYQ